MSQKRLRKAFDTNLQLIVTAEEAAKNEGYEFNRYKCVICGEEVIVAASESTKVSVHFRHRRGNNNVNCENYFGQSNSTVAGKRQEKIDFYYDHANKTFCMSLSLSEEEIEFYEQNNAQIELRTEKSSEPFLAIQVNRTYFIPDEINFITIQRFSFNYFVSNSMEKITRKCSLFNRNNYPTFFKILGREEAFKAKYVSSGNLYTNTKYLMVTPYTNKQTDKFLNLVEVEQKFLFETMNKKFYGFIFRINRIASLLSAILSEWNYRLSPHESITVLWPPTYMLDTCNLVRSEYLYVYTSFDLYPKGNINVSQEHVHRLTNNIFKISLLPRTIISKGNAELQIKKENSMIGQMEKIITFSTEEHIFNVPEDDLTYFLFNCYGVTKLAPGQKVFVTSDSTIVGFKQSYPLRQIVPKRHVKKFGEDLLIDILAHYKRIEACDTFRYDSNLSDSIISYINKCNKVGTINSLVKRYIEEGKFYEEISSPIK